MTDDTTKQDNRAVGAVAVATSVTALACGVCCVLPFAIPAAMLGSFGAIIAWFAGVYGWLTPVAIAAVAAGWMWLAVQSRRSRKRPARTTLVVMVFATVMSALAYLWPLFEETIEGFLRH
ncbi:MAG: hypothetical protein KGJ57_07685 [Sphingomonadales bacterium]|nr:hypothetical protein [Sphingomonadales bacterium]MDE2169294.1 hypothetical protein [Sphingomonadales bacterium]